MAPVWDRALSRDFCDLPVLMAMIGLPAASALAAAAMKTCGRLMPSMNSAITRVLRVLRPRN